MSCCNSIGVESLLGKDKWEYLVVDLKADNTVLQEDLNKYGKKCWELVQVQENKDVVIATGSNQRGYKLFFKREK